MNLKARSPAVTYRLEKYRRYRWN
uniref:Uncharacterized protein n=1 Tax=Anguilla anguilla TaxID=7936 RepID=A0A0E9WL28_ANGAN